MGTAISADGEPSSGTRTERYILAPFPGPTSLLRNDAIAQSGRLSGVSEQFGRRRPHPWSRRRPPPTLAKSLVRA